MRPPAYARFIETYGYALLAASLVAYILLVSFQTTPTASVPALAVLVCGILAGSAATSHVRRRLWITVPLALVAIGGLVLLPLVGEVRLLEATGQLWFWWIAVCMAFDVVKERMSTAPRLLAAASLYVIAALAFAEFYHMVDRPRTVDAETEPSGAFGVLGEVRELTAEERIYFSFVTQTTLGYGDIVPRSRAARAVATMQATAGVLYLAVLVATIVSIRGREDGTA